VSLARSVLGTPFEHQGRQPDRGLDCAGLVLWIRHRLELTDFGLRNYPRLPQADRLLQLAAEAGFRETEIARSGDVYCRWLARDPQHLAIASECGIIHACQRAGRVIGHRLDGRWRRRIVSIFSYPETR